MIQLSPRGKVIYQFLGLSALLLLLYAAGFLLSASQRLPTPLVDARAAPAILAYRAQVFDLLCLTAFLGAGMMMAGESLGDAGVARLRRIWFLLVIAATPLSLTAHTQIPDLVTALVLLVILASTAKLRDASKCLRIWQAGLLLSALALPGAHFTSGVVAGAIDAFQIHVAFGLCAVSIVFWLLPRCSTLPRALAEARLPIASLLILLGGSLISLGQLSLPAPISLAAAALVAACYIVLASHCARPLRDRNSNASLAAHWVALATLFWLVGGGFLGALGLHPAVNLALPGTDVAAAQSWLGQWVILSVILAFVNEAASALRGDNRRVTGYAPLWLMAFGVSLAGILLVCRGVVQIYLRQLGMATGADEPELLLPLTVVWLAFLLAAAAGSAVYALGFFLRYPKIRVVDR